MKVIGEQLHHSSFNALHYFRGRVLPFDFHRTGQLNEKTTVREGSTQYRRYEYLTTAVLITERRGAIAFTRDSNSR